MTTTMLIDWRGRDKRNIARSGRSVIEPEYLPMWVKKCYDQGWKWLRAEHSGRIVAEITPRSDTAKRTWYAEGGEQS